MLTGTIKKLVKDRGFGFIHAADDAEYFFHRSAVTGPGGYDALVDGQAVRFEVEPSPKGPRACNVTS